MILVKFRVSSMHFLTVYALVYKTLLWSIVCKSQETQVEEKGEIKKVESQAIFEFFVIFFPLFFFFYDRNSG